MIFLFIFILFLRIDKASLMHSAYLYVVAFITPKKANVVAE